jgi:hypothetical protein
MLGELIDLISGIALKRLGVTRALSSADSNVLVSSYLVLSPPEGFRNPALRKTVTVNRSYPERWMVARL